MSFNRGECWSDFLPLAGHPITLHVQTSDQVGGGRVKGKWGRHLHGACLVCVARPRPLLAPAPQWRWKGP